ncbi:MAG: hypothetical protein QF917_01230 [Candidatus Woesearchaeota archaeon]|jgi:hypothetical protein|nr:hypothetical protein [Candidatus Woesearchaeota archaeon]
MQSGKEAIIERRDYLDFLASNASKNTALLGRKKSGKTLILKQYIKKLGKESLPVYIDLEKISLTPENFSIEFIGNILYNFIGKKTAEYKNFLSLENLKKIIPSVKSDKCSEILNSVENELLKIKPGQKFLVESAFKFANALAEEKNKKIVICLDNFENILDLNNFSQINDIISLINFENKDVKYIITSSLINQFKDLKNFEIIEIKNLDKKESALLIEKTVGKTEKKIINEIHELSKGHPLVLKSIASRYKETKNVRKAFLTELLCKEGLIYSYCKNSLSFYLNLARGQSLLKNILKIIAEKELRLSEIALELYRSAPITKAMLERLISVDLIAKKDSRFYFDDKILQLWVKLTSNGYDFDFIPEDKDLEEIQI